MYCVNCGVKLSDTEKKCPLCSTTVYHPDIIREEAKPLYPVNKIPKLQRESKAFNGAIIFLFFIPIIISLISDWQYDKTFSWSGFVSGALFLVYIILALPFWFRKPNPVIFVPCDFLAAAIYLFYINYKTNGNWFLSFALPITAAFCIVTTAMVTLLYYLKKGKLFIIGGSFAAFGVLILLIELLIDVTFNVRFIGWSIYPLVVLSLLGAVMIYLGINIAAREVMERKLFF